MAAAKFRVFIYARKSTDETQNKQLFSIPDQISDLEPLAARHDVDVVNTFEEQKSAKAPYIRQQFDDMLKRVEQGEADGILCWHVNRLARNPVDAGRITWMLQQGIIKKIITPTHTYLPEDSSLLIALEAAMATEQVRDLAKFVKRGMRKKAVERKIFPGRAPLGYRNSRTEHVVDIKVDKKRWNDVRKMWDMLLSGQYTVPEIQRIANDQWQFKTPMVGKRGGGPVGRSSLYCLFSNIFYTGLFQWTGEILEGSHKPMITLDEYDQVQLILGRRGKPRGQNHNPSYTGMIRCGECGNMLTFTEKRKKLATTGQFRAYRYYHCHKSKRDKLGKAICSQKPVRLDKLEQQITMELEKFSVSPKFVDWAIEQLDHRHNQEVEDRNRVRQQQEDAYAKVQQHLDNLTKMRYRDLIDDAEFEEERSKLKTERAKINLLLNNSEHRADTWNEQTKKAFHFASHARSAFEKGTPEVKKEIFSALGSNYVCKDKIVSIEAADWLNPLIDSLPKLAEKYDTFEPDKDVGNKGQKEEIVDLILLLCPLADDVRTAIAGTEPNISIPNIRGN